MISSPTSHQARRTLSFALLLAALCLSGLAFSPISTLQATGANTAGTAPTAASQQRVAGESPQVAAFRQAVGGSITPLIIELKKQPVVLRKVAEEQAGRAMAFEDVVSYTKEILAEQNAFIAKLGSRGVSALVRQQDVKQLSGATRRIDYRFTYLLNGFVAYVATQDIDRLKALPEVAHVSEPTRAKFHLNRAVDYSLGTQTNPADRRTAVYGATKEFEPVGSPGHPEAPARNRKDGFEGHNMNVAVIDTGVDYRHPMFGGIGQETPLPRISGQAASSEDNKKVIYFYAFSEPVGDPTDDFGHGTLVASCAAGYRVDGNTEPRLGYGLGFDGQGVGPTPNNAELFGTAPQARIMAYKVCDIAGNCAGDVELSIEDAASPVTLVGAGDGGSVPTMVPKPVADVINLSLGDEVGNPAGASARAANNAALAGTIVVASAGNSGTDDAGERVPGSIGSPSAATLAISVAASLDPGSIGGADVLAPNQIPGETRLPATPGPSPEVGASSNMNAPQPNERQGIKIFPVAGGGSLPTEENPGEPGLNTGSLSAHYVYVEDPNATPPEVRNRIALVRGGTGTFFNIVNAVAVQMPAAIIITDDRESLTAVVVAGEVPVFNVTTEVTTYLINRISNTDTDSDGDGLDDAPVGSISQFPLRLAESVSPEAFQGSMAGFSSFGPNDHPNANFRTIKPDVTAPGVGIVGAATVEGLPDETIGLASTTGYTSANGTSFSGPITAGAMALLRQRVREELKLDTTTLDSPQYRAKRFDTVTVARALLQNSATNLRNGLGEPQPDGAGTASINEMGSGHINLADALKAKAIMVAPTLLRAEPQEYGNPLIDPPTDPIPVMIPTASFGAVGVVNFNGVIERKQEVVIRDVLNGGGAGNYNLTVQNNRLADREGFEISFTSPDGQPITSVDVPAGGQSSFFVRVRADGRQIKKGPKEFQWYVTATAASGDTLRMPFYYRAVLPDPTVPQAQLQNISTRLRVQTGDNVGIGGLIIRGGASKRVIFRALGPSLNVNGSPLTGRLQDPVLQLFDGNGVLLFENNNWKDTQRQAIEKTGLAPKDDRESAIVRTLPAGAYTAVIRGLGNTTGVGLVEAYDLDESGSSKLLNISTRGFVQTDDNVLIGGFIAGRYEGDTTVVVRAIGPSLQDEIPSALDDTTLELRDGNGALVEANDDWQQHSQAGAISNTGLAPKDNREAAIIQTVQPGNYTAIVRGKNGTTGTGLVEVYNIRQ